ncbi:hypothetical protein [uncultured Psychrobacter sp.]|uniref:hypothetical protein n=1 Tax=uncultured Psychrobacter sp. TaxID=259303 RepID=UPI003457C758
MQYTAIIKDGGLFIPNVFADLNDGSSHIVQVEMDIEEVREQLSTNNAPKETKALRKPPKRQAQKAVSKPSPDADASALSKGDVGELEGLNDMELSEIIKAYMNDESASSQISLENL